MRFVRFGLAAAVLLIAACTPSGATSPATMTPGLPTAAQSTPASTSPSVATRVEITLTDAMRIEPAMIEVPAGVPVTFVVTNDGVIDHEFFLGDEAAQAEHEAEMAMGGMIHDEPEGISVKPGATKELTFTFASASGILAGCHVPGHYAAGMRASLIITP